MFMGNNIVVITAYSNVLETYAFYADAKELVWTKTASGGRIDKVHMLRSACVFE